MKIHFLKRYPVSFLMIIAFSFLLAACRNEKPINGFSIHGMIPEVAGKKLLLQELDPKATLTLDSVTAGQDGEFTFTHPLETAGFFLVQFPDGKELALCLEKGDSLKIGGSTAALPGSITVSGSPGTEILQDFYVTSATNKQKVDSLKGRIQSAEGTPELMQVTQTADSVFAAILETQRELEKSTIDRHKDNLAVLLILNYSLGTAPVLTMDEDLDLYQKLTVLSDKYPGNKHVVYHQQRIRDFLERKAGPKFR